jgi:hypothetical protein
MTEADTKTSEEIGRIELALNTTLAAIEAHDRLRKADPNRRRREIRAMSLDEIFALSPVEDFLNDPVGMGLRRSIKELGRRLFTLGGTALMGRVCDRVAEMGGSWDRGMTIVNATWDGIGSWLA